MGAGRPFGTCAVDPVQLEAIRFIATEGLRPSVTCLPTLQVSFPFTRYCAIAQAVLF
ncbi:hypothetical protein SAMN05444156_1571 [Verrucomicrobium sp. GAS474]|nr:hypothetical protein SAMN05444156_1571 [Verrucomicrobium sp. GAS474]